MSCSRYECAYLAIIIGIIAGVILGVLYSLGFVATGIIFWAYLAIGLAGVFLSPIYGFLNNMCGGSRCFCSSRVILLVATVGTIITAAIGFIVASVASTTVVAIVVGLATFFVVMLIVAILCVARCICEQRNL